MSIVPQESAALAILDKLEHLAEGRLPDLARVAMVGEDERHSYLLTLGRDGAAVAGLDAQLTVGQVDFLIGMHNHADTLLALARLGLEKAGVVSGQAPGNACRSCGSVNICRSRTMLHRDRVAYAVWCADCDANQIEIGGAVREEPHVPGNVL